MAKKRIVVYLADDETRVLEWARQELRLDSSASFRHILLEWMQRRNAHLFKNTNEMLLKAKAQVDKEHVVEVLEKPLESWGTEESQGLDD